MTNSGGKRTKSQSVINAHRQFQVTLLLFGVVLLALGTLATVGIPIIGDSIPPSPEVDSDDDPSPESEEPKNGDSESPTSSDDGGETDVSGEDGTGIDSPISDSDDTGNNVASLSDQGEDSQILKIEAEGSEPIRYESAVTDRISPMDSQTAEHSSVEDMHISGEITEGSHSFEFSGDITNLVIDGDANVYIDDDLVFSTEETRSNH